MLKIKKYQPKYINEWNKFILNSNNGTLFHNQQFIAYHINRRFIDCSLMIYYNNKLIALFPAAMKDDVTVFSHPGASHGGLVIKTNLDFSILNDIIKEIDSFYKRKKNKFIFIINTPKIYYKNLHDSLDYLLQWNGYNQEELYISHVVSLLDAPVHQLLSKRKQRYIKNKNHQYKFIESADFNDFYVLLEKNKKIYNALPTHSLEELKKLNALFPNQVKLFLSKNNNTTVGGSLLFFINPRVCLVFYNVVSNQHRSSQLSTFQFYSAMKIAKEQGCEIVDFGVSHSPEKKNPFEPKLSLIKFKEQFGAFGVLRTGYKKEL